MKRKSTINRKIVIFIIIVTLLVISTKLLIYFDNETVGVTRYTVSNSKIPLSFDGYKIILLADFQSTPLITQNSFYKQIENENANILVIAGDLVDDDIPNLDKNINTFLHECNLPKDCYAVSGNHDLWSHKYAQLKATWLKAGNLKFLENQKVTISKNGEQINLYGISDPDVWKDYKSYPVVKKSIKALNTNTTDFNMLLFHRANMLDMFNNKTFDLIMSGHLHGGQIRIPFIGGLKSPHGDWFPKYSGGQYIVNKHNYIVSRGIGNAVKYPRIFNRPEIVVIELKKD